MKLKPEALKKYEEINTKMMEAYEPICSEHGDDEFGEMIIANFMLICAVRLMIKNWMNAQVISGHVQMLADGFVKECDKGEKYEPTSTFPSHMSEQFDDGSRSSSHANGPNRSVKVRRRKRRR